MKIYFSAQKFNPKRCQAKSNSLFFQTFLPSENVQISSPQVAEEVNCKPTTLTTQSGIFFLAFNPPQTGSSIMGLL
jgi:hypothetical protein